MIKSIAGVVSRNAKTENKLINQLLITTVPRGLI